MTILSESIFDYINLNYGIEESETNLERVKELVVNSYNYSMEIPPFCPEELSYLTKLEDCTFINFEITDDIIENLNKLSNLKKISLDNCKLKTNKNINIDEIYIESSEVNFQNMNTKKITILDCDTVDINDIKFDNLEDLTILNANIINSKNLKNFNCRINIMGCKLDNNEIIKELKNINYKRDEYKK